MAKEIRAVNAIVNELSVCGPGELLYIDEALTADAPTGAEALRGILRRLGDTGPSERKYLLSKVRDEIAQRKAEAGR